ncbi:MAG: hypothetical protein QM692_19520 [Thermomicrobiales bacterium]
MATLPAASATGAIPPHILIMDACAPVRDLLLDALAPAGYRLTAWHALLDIADVAALQPDLIIMERVFAGSMAASRQFLRQASQDPTLTRVPVVLSTTQSPRGCGRPATEALQDEAVHLLIKPYAIDDLLALVQTCVDSGPPPASRVAGPGSMSRKRIDAIT